MRLLASTFFPITHCVKRRGLFSIATSSTELKEYAERRTVGYSCEQMYDVVANVGRYNEFVPWCTCSDILQRTPSHDGHTVSRARMAIGFAPLVESYHCTITTMKRPYVVKSIADRDARLFDHLVNFWQFHERHSDNEALQCDVEMSVAFRFRSRLHARIAHVFFDEVVKTMVNSFLKRAAVVHGPPSLPASKAQVLSYRS